MSDWEETSLGELIDIKHGYAFKGEFFTEVPNRNALLTPGNFHIGGGFKADKFKYYTGDIPEDYVLSPGAVIVTMTDLSKDGDTLGYSARIPESKNRFLHNQRLGLVTTASKKADINFIYWLLRTDHYQKSVVNSCSGSTVKHTSPSKIKDYEFLLPPISQQKAIDKVLSSFDRKISNLRQQNETLEAIAQTLFKHWFVDFEFPNEDGKPYKSSGGEMVRSELGELPVGWRVGTMADVIEVRDGTHESPKQTDKGFHLITSKHLKKEGIDFESAYLISEFDYVEANKRSKVDTLDILLSMIGTVGLLYFVMEQEINFAIKNIGLFKSSKNQDYAEFIFLFLTSDYGSSYLRARLSGTTQSYVTLASLREMPLMIPDEITLLEFRKIIKSIFSKSYANRQQVQTLTKTRDRLLPKLMSGKLRITEL